jgi:hypothetical protein
MDIEANLKKFVSDPGPDRRYASFDYCFNYFQSFREADRVKEIAASENMELSCLHLGFYLASWGMFRGSSVLRDRSLSQFKPIIELIANAPREIWQIDADSYSLDTSQALVHTASEIQRSLQFPEGRWPSRTLATKVMLGVFGNVPAFDTWVRSGLAANGMVQRFGLSALQAVGRFYQENVDVVERHRVPTLDFETSQPTDRRYTHAKVIDMIFYVEGGGRRGA